MNARPRQGEELEAVRAGVRARIGDSNVNPATFLATDYLNHFNEVAMLFEMLADMPEVIADIAAWRPLGYCEHFAKSGLADADLAIAAYAVAPQAHRARFDATIETLNATIVAAIERIGASAEVANAETLVQLRQPNLPDLHALIERAAGLINAAAPLREAAGPAETAAECAQDRSTQAEIDALFADI